MPILWKRLASHLQALAAQVKNPEIVQLNTPLVKPTSICVASTHIPLCADDEHQRIIQLELSYKQKFFGDHFSTEFCNRAQM